MAKTQTMNDVDRLNAEIQSFMAEADAMVQALGDTAPANIVQSLRELAEVKAAPARKMLAKLVGSATEAAISDFVPTIESLGINIPDGKVFKLAVWRDGNKLIGTRTVAERSVKVANGVKRQTSSGQVYTYTDEDGDVLDSFEIRKNLTGHLYRLNGDIGEDDANVGPIGKIADFVKTVANLNSAPPTLAALDMLRVRGYGFAPLADAD